MLKKIAKRVAAGSLVIAGVAIAADYGQNYLREKRSYEGNSDVFADEYARKHRSITSNVRPIPCQDGTQVIPWIAPTRQEQIDRIKKEEFDILVIGGGCVGAGVALDASSRGLNCAMIESNDFGSGTSSRSTKLIHGGVRYLEAAVFNMDTNALHLVNEALEERAFMMFTAPYMSKPLPIMIPCYQLHEIPMYWLGMKLYDFIAHGDRFIPSSHFITKGEASYRFPSLKTEGLKGAVVYYDGIHNDARMNLHIALTAAQSGASVVNHTRLIGILKDKDGIICGAEVQDKITNEKYKVKCKVVVNATGPFADAVRQMDNPSVEKVIVPAAGVHIVLPDHFSPDNMGLILPKTKDGRVLFFLPWEGSTLAGTTDSESEITETPTPTAKDVGFIIAESQRVLNRKIQHEDVRSAWSGIRPLVRDSSSSTAEISRNHVVEVSPSHLVSIMGGKWTTFRRMAEDAVDAAVNVTPALSETRRSRSKHIQLVGADRAKQVCSQSFHKITITLRERFNLDKDLAVHLMRNYGTRALQVVDVGTDKEGKLKYERLHTKYPLLDLEVVFGVTHDYALTIEDIIARRLRIAFLDTSAAREIVPKVGAIMQRELKWSNAQLKSQIKSAYAFLDTMQGSP